MMGRHTSDQGKLFYAFDLDMIVPTDHLLRGIDAVLDLSELHQYLATYYSHTGRSSIDPELMMRMLIVGYSFGIRSERRLCEEVRLNLAYRWFCRLGLEDPVPDHSTFSKNRHGRFRDSGMFRHVFEGVLARCMKEGLVGGEGFAVDASIIKADARLAKQYGRYGYRKIAALLRIEGWQVNHKKVERLWREEGLQIPQRHRKRKRLYHKDSSVIRLRPRYQNHIWSMDFVHDKLASGRPYKMLTVLDEYSREALCVAVKPQMGNAEVLEALYPLFLKHGRPAFIRSDNGPEFIAENFQTWLAKAGIKPIRIYPGSPWENGYNERFNGTLRREVLNAEWFTSIRQAQIVIETWLKQYNHIRPHQALNMRPPVPETLSESGT
jgi:putative transposase